MSEKRWHPPYVGYTLYRYMVGIARILAALVLIMLGANIWSVTRGLFEGSPPASVRPYIEKQESERQQVVRDIESLRNEIQQLRTAPTSLPTDYAAAQKIDRLEAAVNNVSERIGKLESVILDNPAKAAALPLLQHDLDSLRKSQEVSSIALQGQISQIQDFYKWFLGLLVVALVGAGVLSVFKRAEKKEEGKADEPE